MKGSAKQTLREAQQRGWRNIVYLQFAVDDVQVFFPTFLRPARSNTQNRVLLYSSAYCNCPRAKPSAVS